MKALHTELTALPQSSVDATTQRAGHLARDNRPTLRELKPQALGRKPLSEMITIKTPDGVKSLHIDTYQAIRRAIPIYDDDRRVLSYAALPCEGITPDTVAHIRRRMMISGKLPARAFSRRMEHA